MPKLEKYTQFDGYYWETGTLRNVLEFEGAIAPHTGEPYTEAMLLGISGGVTFGYFTFHYEGYDPQVNLLTRNTFEPMDTIFQRMNIPREVLQTTILNKARTNLIETLEDGHAPIVWLDMYLLPYNGLTHDHDNWAVMPVVVYGYTVDNHEAWIADRSFTGLCVSTEDVDAAWSRVKKKKHRLITLEHPDPDQLPEAVRAGIADCVHLMTEKPPRGSARNFGLRGLQHWAEMLEKDKAGSWSREYRDGRTLLSVLMSSYYFLGPGFGKTMQAERDTYADFLDEAAVVLEQPVLENVAVRYRMAGKAWAGLLAALLPEDVPMLKKARYLIDYKYELLSEKGSEATDAIRQTVIDQVALKEEAGSDFPLAESEIADLRAEIRRHVLLVHDAEEAAVMGLKAILNDN
jgi:hypothetical protein